MKARKSALKHRLSEVDGVFAAEHHLYIADLDACRANTTYRRMYKDV